MVKASLQSSNEKIKKGFKHVPKDFITNKMIEDEAYQIHLRKPEQSDFDNWLGAERLLTQPKVNHLK